MPVIRRDQILLDVRMERRLLVWMFPRFFENETGAGLAQTIPDQYAARTIEEGIDRQCIFPFEFRGADGTTHTART